VSGLVTPKSGVEVMKKVSFLLLFSVVAAVSVATATIRHVPSEYPTIQAGIDAAIPGDTVLVADGIYTGDGNHSIDFKRKPILVTSENGPEVTIIDLEGIWAHGFVFLMGEDSNSVVQGFTIRNGFKEENFGTGIYCYSSSPTIRGNVITGNTAALGGGICCYDSWALIEGNTITGNTAKCFPNYASGRRGYGGGAGIYCSASSLTIKGNTITGNMAEAWGSGIFCLNYSSLNIEGNVIAENTAEGWWGGGIYCESSSLTLNHNTIARNVAYVSGGGISCHDGASVSIFNSILWADSAGTGHEIYLEDETCEAQVFYSDIEGGWEGEGNIDADPLFLMPTKHDYRLLWGSPCIDSGDPNYLDPDGTRSDMGAFYFDQSSPVTIYLTPDTTAYHRKENLGVTYTVINIDPDPVTFSLQTDVYLPSGNPYPGNPIVGPKEVTLPGEKTKQRWIKHYIPGNAPLGVYTYSTTLNSVLYDDVIDEDSFRFVVEE
jgi:hypothetical protein